MAAASEHAPVSPPRLHQSWRSRFLILCAAVVALGCATAPGASSRSGSRSELLRAELQRWDHSSLYDAIRAARPQWFRPTVGSVGSSESRSLSVFVDGTRFGEVGSLRDIQVRHVARVQYLTASEAQQKYGLRSSAPALDIALIRGR